MNILLSASCVKIWHQKQTQLSRSVLWLEPTELVMPRNTHISGGPLIPKPVTKGSLPWSRGAANYLEWSFSSFVGREEGKKKCCDHRSKHYGCFHAGWAYKTDVLENEVWGLLHGRESRKKYACVVIFTVPAGLTEQVPRSLHFLRRFTWHASLCEEQTTRVS